MRDPFRRATPASLIDVARYEAQLAQDLREHSQALRRQCRATVDASLRIRETIRLQHADAGGNAEAHPGVFGPPVRQSPRNVP